MSDLPLCGNGWEGFGCGQPITHHSELFRCADCRIPMHHSCLVHHFGDGIRRNTDQGAVQVHKAHHAYAQEMAWLVGEILKRDKIIADLSDGDSHGR